MAANLSRASLSAAVQIELPVCRSCFLLVSPPNKARGQTARQTATGELTGRNRRTNKMVKVSTADGDACGAAEGRCCHRSAAAAPPLRCPARHRSAPSSPTGCGG